MDNFRPIPFYFINTKEKLSKTDIFNAVEKLKENGFGGCILFNKPPDGFSQSEYLSDKWFAMIENFALAGRQLKMQIWINDGFDFPPGDAGGRIQKINPKLKQKMLKAAGKDEFEIVELDWGFPAFEEPESSKLFIELVYEEYYSRLEEYFGNGITGFFSDADCRRINAHVLNEMNGRPYYPWSQNFAEEFFEKYSYRIEPHLAKIVRGLGSAELRRDYWQLAGELYASWFQNNYQWCRKHNVLYSFHTSDTGPFPLKDCIRSSVFAEGSFLNQARFCDYPGTDHELLALDGGTHFDSRYYIASSTYEGNNAKARTPDFNITKWDLRAKYTASAAYIYGKERALCETFAATNWGATHQDLRRIAAWQIMQGINCFVPHAVHHLFHGETKYFAPPEFLSGSLRHGLRKFNDALAEMCFIASQGELADPLAVFDPTEAVWSGKKHSLYEICDKLNRMPVNYVIVNEAALRERPKRFKQLLLPGITLPPDLTSILTNSGCTILDDSELGKIELPDISFRGGDIHFMLRRLDEGCDMLLAANVWSDDTLAGTLRFNGKLFDLELAPGEIAVLNGQFEKLRSPNNNIPSLKLPLTMPVIWSEDNVVPLLIPEDFCFYNTAEIPEPYLLAPEGVEFYFDGNTLPEGESCKFFDDNYKKVKLPEGGTPGMHSIRMYCPSKNKAPMVYLRGEFDVKVKTGNDFFRKYMDLYNMQLYLPEKLETTLSPRSKSLDAGEWSEQGAPFYSGAVTYITEINHTGGTARLNLGKINGTCAVKLNGHQLSTLIWEPFEYTLDLKEGINSLEITVTNTFANLLECYKASGGLPQPENY